MVKYTQTICRLLPTNCLSLFDHFVGLTLKGLTHLSISGKTPCAKKQSNELQLMNQNSNNNTGHFTIGNLALQLYGQILM